MDGGESFRRIGNRRVICTGGFHKDGISAEEIREVQESVVRLTEMCDKKIAGVVCGSAWCTGEGVGTARPGERYCLPSWHFNPEGTETNVNVLSCSIDSEILKTAG